MNVRAWLLRGAGAPDRGRRAERRGVGAQRRAGRRRAGRGGRGRGLLGGAARPRRRPARRRRSRRRRATARRTDGRPRRLGRHDGVAPTASPRPAARPDWRSRPATTTRGAELAAIVAADADRSRLATLRSPRPGLVPARRRRRRRRRRGRHDRRAARRAPPSKGGAWPTSSAAATACPTGCASPRDWRGRGHRQRRRHTADGDHERSSAAAMARARTRSVARSSTPHRAAAERRRTNGAWCAIPRRHATRSPGPSSGNGTATRSTVASSPAAAAAAPARRPAWRTHRPAPASRRTRPGSTSRARRSALFDDRLHRVVVVGGVGADGDGSPRPRHPGRLGESGGRVGEVVERERRQHDVDTRGRASAGAWRRRRPPGGRRRRRRRACRRRRRRRSRPRPRRPSPLATRLRCRRRRRPPPRHPTAAGRGRRAPAPSGRRCAPGRLASVRRSPCRRVAGRRSWRSRCSGAPGRQRRHSHRAPSVATSHHQRSSSSSPHAFSHPNCTSPPSRHRPSWRSHHPAVSTP